MSNRRYCVDYHTHNKEVKGLKAWGLKEGWHENGSRILYGFGYGLTDEHRKEWEYVLKEVMEFVNLTFIESTDYNKAVLRIEHRKGRGSWSTVGTDCFNIPAPNPTMNIGWMGLETKRHELGHFLGLGHEHQNPREPKEFNKDVVYEDLKGAPNFWNKDDIDFNMFNLYSESMTVGTRTDDKSIMMYPMPKEWLKDGRGVKQNLDFSEQDKVFLSSIYPFDSDEVKPRDAIEFLVIDILEGRYHNLISFRARTLKRICAFLGVPISRRKRDNARAILKNLNIK